MNDDIMARVNDLSELVDVGREIGNHVGPCQFDHHGYCQAHFWLEARCPYGRLRDILRRIAERQQS